MIHRMPDREQRTPSGRLCIDRTQNVLSLFFPRGIRPLGKSHLIACDWANLEIAPIFPFFPFFAKVEPRRAPVHRVSIKHTI